MFFPWFSDQYTELFLYQKLKGVIDFVQKKQQ